MNCLYMQLRYCILLTYSIASTYFIHVWTIGLILFFTLLLGFQNMITIILCELYYVKSVFSPKIVVFNTF